MGGLNNLFKGKKVKKSLGYGKYVILEIANIEERTHRFSNGNSAMRNNWMITFTSGDVVCVERLDDLPFVKPFFKRVKEYIQQVYTKYI